MSPSDSRKERPEAGTGVRLRLHGEHAFSLSAPLDQRWVKYGASLGSYLDLTGENHVVSLTGVVRFADPIDGEVPFTELAELSDHLGAGEWPMRASWTIAS